MLIDTPVRGVKPLGAKLAPFLFLAPNLHQTCTAGSPSTRFPYCSSALSLAGVPILLFGALFGRNFRIVLRRFLRRVLQYSQSLLKPGSHVHPPPKLPYLAQYLAPSLRRIIRIRLRTEKGTGRVSGKSCTENSRIFLSCAKVAPDDDMACQCSPLAEL